MVSLAVTVKGQLTLTRDLLHHLGIKPGERVEFAKLPAGELGLWTARPSGSIDDFFAALDGKVALTEPLTIEDIGQIAATGWARNLDGE